MCSSFNDESVCSGNADIIGGRFTIRPSFIAFFRACWKRESSPSSVSSLLPSPPPPDGDDPGFSKPCDTTMDSKISMSNWYPKQLATIRTSWTSLLNTTILSVIISWKFSDIVVRDATASSSHSHLLVSKSKVKRYSRANISMYWTA